MGNHAPTPMKAMTCAMTRRPIAVAIPGSNVCHAPDARIAARSRGARPHRVASPRPPDPGDHLRRPRRHTRRLGHHPRPRIAPWDRDRDRPPRHGGYLSSWRRCQATSVSAPNRKGTLGIRASCPAVTLSGLNPRPRIAPWDRDRDRPPRHRTGHGLHRRRSMVPHRHLTGIWRARACHSVGSGAP
jgi:hypothetical protein